MAEQEESASSEFQQLVQALTAFFVENEVWRKYGLHENDAATIIGMLLKTGQLNWRRL